MKNQIIKLHDEFVDKGMPPSNINIIFLLKHASRIHDRNIGYVLLDMQTWLREEHGIYAFSLPFEDLNSFLAVVDATTPSGFERLYISDNEFETYKEALLSGLQEAIKLIK